MTNPRAGRAVVRNTRPEDFEGIIELTGRVYPGSAPWRRDQLARHLEVFPEGQFVAHRPPDPTIVGMAASLIVRWDDYEETGTWAVWTDRGTFANHDPVHGRTLYGAEVMVDPALQRSGVGARLYAARRDVTRRLGLLRIRAAARLRGYHRVAKRMAPEEYVVRVVRGELRDPTLTFQLREGFEVLRVVGGYLAHDPDSQGYAAIIEWLNLEVAHPEDWAGRDPRYARPAAPA